MKRLSKKITLYDRGSGEEKDELKEKDEKKKERASNIGRKIRKKEILTYHLEGIKGFLVKFQ